jgi:hypothetical protein
VYGSADVLAGLSTPAIGVAGLVTFNGTGAGTGTPNSNALHCALIGYATRAKAVINPTTTVATTLSAPTNTISIADVSAFQYDTAPILINGHPYYQTAHSGTSGAGTISTLVNISVADGTAGHIVTANNNPQIFGANIYAYYTTGLPSAQTGYQIGMELDISCNGLDNGGTGGEGIRTIMNVIGAQYSSGGAAAEIGTGYACFAATNVTFKRMYSATGPFSEAAFDARKAVQQSNANALWLATGGRLAFDTAGTGGAANLTLSSNGSNLTVNGGTFVVGGSMIAYGQLFIESGVAAIDGAAGTQRELFFNTGGSNRWQVQADNSAESGSNAGTNFNIGRFNDAGNWQENSLSIARATGQVTIGTGGMAVGGAVTVAGSAMTINGTGGDPLVVHVVAGQYARGRYNIAGSDGWSCGAQPGNTFAISDETAGIQGLVVSALGDLAVHRGFGVNGAAPVVPKPTVTGAKGGNTALASLLTALAAYGLVTDSTTA